MCSADPDRGIGPQRVGSPAHLLHYDHLQSTVAKCYSMHLKWPKFWRTGDAGSELDSYRKGSEISADRSYSLAKKMGFAYNEHGRLSKNIRSYIIHFTGPGILIIIMHER